MKTVLITGASRGFGRELFALYDSRGWATFPLVRSHYAAAELQASVDADCHPIIADVASELVGAEISRVLEQNCKSLDLLINNAGNIKKLRGLANTSAEDLEDLFRVHCVGVFRCVEAALPFLERAARPVIVNVSSRWGSIARTVSGKGGGIYSYQIAKSAQNMLTACLNQELKPRGVMVFAVHPGKLQTEAAAPDADTDPGKAAIALADWIDGVDDGVVCGFHDPMGGGIIEW